MIGEGGKWQCGLHLFLSVDISGSTRYKNSRPDSDAFPPYWKALFELFYTSIEARFRNHIKTKDKRDELFQRPGVWKLLGDEIIFECLIYSETEALRLVSAFLKAVRDLDAEIRGLYPVRLKGTAWTAGTPIRNAPFETPSTGAKGQADYIGPDMDIGFRICKLSQPGRMAISMDLADILSREDVPGNLRFYHVGWQVLEGVFDNKPYPVIWLNDSDPQFIPPWEEEGDERTKCFMSKEKVKDKDALQKLVASVRASLPHLRLFPPYFSEDDMPPYHKAIVEKQRQIMHRDPLDAYEEGGEDAAD